MENEIKERKIKEEENFWNFLEEYKKLEDANTTSGLVLRISVCTTLSGQYKAEIIAQANDEFTHEVFVYINNEYRVREIKGEVYEEDERNNDYDYRYIAYANNINELKYKIKEAVDKVKKNREILRKKILRNIKEIMIEI